VAVIIPVSERLSTKLLGTAVGAKRAALAAPEVAEKMTGYVVGGVSPFGQRRRLLTFVDMSAAACERIAVSGGRRGLQLLVTPEDLLVVTDGTLAPLVA
jgi:Cys-tRNA(Pro)/Cys-tRNA(Cys) deacylase